MKGLGLVSRDQKQPSSSEEDLVEGHGHVSQDQEQPLLSEEDLVEGLGHVSQDQEQPPSSEDLVEELGHVSRDQEQPPSSEDLVEELGHVSRDQEQPPSSEDLVEELGHVSRDQEQPPSSEEDLVEELGHVSQDQEQPPSSEDLEEELGHVSLDQEQPPSSEEDSVHLLSNKLDKLPPLSSKCCIYKVPGRIRDENSSAYTPRIVSIGPLHRDKDLKAMEEQKLHYLKSFLQRSNVGLRDYFKFMKEREQKVRDSYAESFGYITSNDFVQMMIVDAAFIVELLWRNCSEKKDLKDDHIFKKPGKVNDVMYDLMLLENQIPFFILEDIFVLAKLKVPLSNEKVSLIKLAHKLFGLKAYLDKIDDDIIQRIRSSKVKHFVDFFIACHVPKELPRKEKIQTVNIPSVTDLYEAGGRFEVGSTKSLFDIQFRKGTLAIPHLRIRKSTESFILNLVAFEQCHLLEGYISNYVFVVDRLVDSTEAVRLLAQSGVIETTLPDLQEVVDSIDNMVRGSVLRRNNFYFNELCDNLNAYCGNRLNRWFGSLKNKHFSSPLTIFAVVVGLAIFVLTLLQTICSCGLQF